MKMKRDEERKRQRLCFGGKYKSLPLFYIVLNSLVFFLSQNTLKNLQTFGCCVAMTFSSPATDSC